jgi:hypothetical protein
MYPVDLSRWHLIFSEKRCHADEWWISACQMRGLRAHLLCECFFLRNLLTSLVMLSDCSKKLASGCEEWHIFCLSSMLVVTLQPYTLCNNLTHAVELICVVITSLVILFNQELKTLAVYRGLIISQLNPVLINITFRRRLFHC